MRAIRMAVAALALIVPLTQADIERAMTLARAAEAERARFHSRYLLPIGDATVEQIEIITEFRRVVMLTEERLRRGEYVIMQRDVEAALGGSHGKVTITARLRFHPLNVFVAAPPYEIGLGVPPLARLDSRRTPLYALAGPNQKPGASAPLVGATVEADFDAATVGQATRPVRVMLEGKEIVRTMVDFGRLE